MSALRYNEHTFWCHIGNLFPLERSSRSALEDASGRYHLYISERSLRSGYLVIASLHIAE